MLGELDGVAEEVDEDLAEARGVADHHARNRGVDAVGKSEALVAGAVGDEVDGLGDAGGDVVGLALELDVAGLDLGIIEGVVDDDEQGFARELDGAEQLALLLAERGAVEDLRHADHAVERRADLVAHRGEEGALGGVGGLGGAREAPGFLDGGLQLEVGAAEVFLGGADGGFLPAALGDVGEDAEDAGGRALVVADDIGTDKRGEDAAALVLDVRLAVPRAAGADAGVNLQGDGLVGEERGGLLGGVEVLDGVAEEGDVGFVVEKRIGIHVADADGVGGAVDGLDEALELGLGGGEISGVSFGLRPGAEGEQHEGARKGSG